MNQASTLIRPSRVFTLVYVSSARRLVEPEEMSTLLRHSRKRNAQVGITGVLLYSGGTFMQALEGDESAVRRLYARIAQDRRHVGPMVMLEETTSRRQFGTWRMSYDGPAAEARDGYSDWNALKQPAPIFHPGRAATLVRGFGVSGEQAAAACGLCG